MSTRATGNLFVLSAILLAATFSKVFAISIDGQLSEPEWEDSQQIVTLYQITPHTGELAELKTEIKFFSDEDGLYFGVKNDQPASLHTSTLSSRDSDIQADYNRILIDFDGKGATAYEFTVASGNSIQDAVLSNGNQRSSEWDGKWQSATSTSDTNWITEVFIPWTVAPMTAIDGPEREINLYVERHIFKRRELFATINLSSNPQFITRLEPYKVANFNPSSFEAFVNIVGNYDANQGDSEGQIGGDLFWKPTSDHQVSLTVKPDFSQVESDDIVISFSPEETFFSEKRSFFTENQGVFTGTTPLGINYTPTVRFIHTRRIGARPDGGDRPIADILAAGKYTLTTNKYDLGVFSAIEENEDGVKGRKFYAARGVTHINGSNLAIGATYTDRPEINRTARVVSGEGSFSLNDKTILRTVLYDSAIEIEGEDKAQGQGGFANLEFNQTNSAKHGVQVMSLDKKIDLNDSGFLARNDLKLLGYRFDNEITHSKDSSVQADEYGLRYTARENFAKERLPTYMEFYHHRKYRNTGRVFSFVQHHTQGLDDQITRGNGSVRRPAYSQIFSEYYWDQSGAFRHHFGFWCGHGGFAGQDTWWHWHPSYYFSDYTNATLGLFYLVNKGWKTWTGVEENSGRLLLSEFDKEEATVRFDINHSFAKRQEIRLNLQWVGIAAKYRKGYFVQDQSLIETADTTSDDFTRSQFGLQIRYKYQISELSNFYLAYSRGGPESCDSCRDSIGKIFSEGIKNKDANQFFVKLRMSI